MLMPLAPRRPRPSQFGGQLAFAKVIRVRALPSPDRAADVSDGRREGRVSAVPNAFAGGSPRTNRSRPFASPFPRLRPPRHFTTRRDTFGVEPSVSPEDVTPRVTVQAHTPRTGQDGLKGRPLIAPTPPDLAR